MSNSSTNSAPLSLPGAADIKQAQHNLQDYITETPLVPLHYPVEGKEIYLKLENLLPFGSFKVRAAFNILKSQPNRFAGRQLLTTSAGNFGQGLAYVAKQLGLALTVVVPEHASPAKIANMEALGASVIKTSFDNWWTALESRQYPDIDGEFIHPVCEQGTLNGNATIALEIASQLPDVNAVITPYGGGGLTTGVGAGLRAFCPGAKLYAAETEASTPLGSALAAGHPVKVDHKQSFIDGMGGSQVIEEMWELVKAVVTDTLCSTIADVEQAIRILASHQHVIAEGAGAASLAAALSNPGLEGRVVCVISGGNIDPQTYSGILKTDR